MLPFGILGIIIAYMLSKKAFTFKGVWKPALIYIAAVFVLFAVVEYDITGFERRIPDIDDVASVNVAYEQFNEDDYNESESYREFNGKEYYFSRHREFFLRAEFFQTNYRNQSFFTPYIL